MKPVSIIAVFVGISLVSEVANAYTVRGLTDTSDGFCRTEEHGDVHVGDTHYSSNPCERVTCGDGGYNIQGCGVINPPENCTLRDGNGVYPDCCPQVYCESEN